MRAFSCPICGRLVIFESLRCLPCGHALGFDWEPRQIVALHDRAYCAGLQLTNCNGLVHRDGDWCESCALTLTRTRPNDADGEALERFASAEQAKRRLIFDVLELELAIVGRREQAGCLAFDFLSSAQEPVSTGHADGVITLDLAEADAAEREQRRENLGEPYRTVLGHMRHEIAHYYQEILAPEGSAVRDECRAVFGDDREDYGQAMDRHYAEGAPSEWEQRFVSAYATMHPWEDWAETFAHYLHIRDTLQTAEAYGMRVDGPQVATTDTAPLHSGPDAPTPDIE